MKIISKIIVAIILLSCVFLLFSCTDKQDNGQTETVTYRFAAPEGTPALAIMRLPTDNKTIAGKNMTYEVVSPSNIAAEMSTGKAELVIMPVNAGVNFIKQSADYKLVSIAVNGSLYMIGRTENGGTITIDDILGKKVACIGKTGVPGLIFRYIMAKNNVTIKESGEANANNREIVVNYVADGSAARALLLNKEENVDFAVVGEPAATTFFNAKPLNLNAKMDLQEAYRSVTEQNVENYPQAGLFVKSSIVSDKEFMDGLYAALAASKAWISANASDVDAFAKENLYASASFPAVAIANCAVNAQKINEEGKNDVIAFLKNVAPGTNWDEIKSSLFIE